MSEYERLQRSHAEHFVEQVDGALQRLWWDTDRLREERRQRLAALLGWAATRSPWHARRLGRLDPGEVTEDRLRDLPTMTKTDLMTFFDDIVTDGRLSRELVEAHVGSLGTADGYLLDEYHAVATAGRTGQPGLVVYDWTSWATCYLTIIRTAMMITKITYPDRFDPATGHLWEGTSVRACCVGADTAAHLSRAAPLTMTTDDIQIWPIPATAPLPAQVEQLEAARPEVLDGFPSALLRLAQEAAAGRLTIDPILVTSQGEPLARPERELLAATWRSPVCEVYTLSECGGVAATCVGGELHVCDDTIIVEPVDAEGRPVAPGEPAAKWYLTNLYNATLPLIRYEVDDPVTLGAGTCACGSAHRTLTVGDRGSDTAAVADQAPGRPARRPAGGDVAAPAAREASHVR